MKPLILINNGEDADFAYATRFLTHDPALYIKFAEGDDALVVNILELGRARETAAAKAVLDRAEHGWAEVRDIYQGWARVAAKLLHERGINEARVSAKIPVAYVEELRAQDVNCEVDKEVFVAERRRKNEEEVAWIHGAQRAAEAAVAEIVSQLATSEEKDGLLWADGRPLTSERLFAYGQSALNEIGYSCDDMIVAGSPQNAMPHYRGAGQIRAGQPVIIDIFPRGRASRYHGDLTRTVVVGEPSAEVQKMYAAVCEALDAAMATIRAGVNGRTVHETVCRVLKEHGYGAATAGFEAPEGVAAMIHSTGHGVGLEVHELPNLRPIDMPLEVGDVVTIEPGLYLDGVGGVRVEDTGLVTATGFKNFTSITRSLDPAAYL